MGQLFLRYLLELAEGEEKRRGRGAAPVLGFDRQVVSRTQLRSSSSRCLKLILVRWFSLMVADRGIRLRQGNEAGQCSKRLPG